MPIDIRQSPRNPIFGHFGPKSAQILFSQLVPRGKALDKSRVNFEKNQKNQKNQGKNQKKSSKKSKSHTKIKKSRKNQKS